MEESVLDWKTNTFEKEAWNHLEPKSSFIESLIDNQGMNDEDSENGMHVILLSRNDSACGSNKKNVPCEYSFSRQILLYGKYGLRSKMYKEKLCAASNAALNTKKSIN
jgi:hypothetical protein